MIELVRRVCLEMNEECTFSFLPNRRAKQYMEQGTVSGTMPLGWNTERDQWMYFSAPLLTTTYSFYAQEESAFTFNQLSDLEGKTIGVFGPSNTQYTLEKIRDEMTSQKLIPFRIEDHPNADGRGLIKLANGRYDLYFVNRDLAEYRIKNIPIKTIKNIGSVKKLEYFIGFAKEHNDPNFITRFNQTILNLYQNGDFKPTWKKWEALPGSIDGAHLKQLNILH
ncbi:transporter substrate-binding domain-containing protein [Vibrio sp. Of7-15]|nr:transporter substrate-binding domain-containing protein [Vibrio sp. Of7-15]